MTRRRLLAASCSTFFSGVSLASTERDSAHPIQIIAEDHALACESKAGFESITRSALYRRPLFVLPAVRGFDRETAWQMRNKADAGATVVLEIGLAYASTQEIIHQSQLVRDVFGIQLDYDARPQRSGVEYISFHWPHETWVRSFGRACTIHPRNTQVIASIGDRPVACKKKIGNGTLVLLGSILGIGINAGDPEALELGRNLLRSAC